MSAPASGVCVRDLPAGQYAPLKVISVPGTSLADYPPVARFGESAQGMPLIGVKCLTGWCEIGPDASGWTLASSPTASPNVRSTRGWFDEQWLAQRLPTGALQPLVFAAVFPSLDVAQHPVTDYSAPVFAGVVVLYANPPASSKYYRWGLRFGENQIYVQNVSGSWTMRIGSAGTAIQMHAHRMPHMDAGVPGTARWRYDSADDGMWVPCGQACCRVDAFY